MRKIPAFFLFFVVTSCLNQANCLVTATNLVKINLKNLNDNASVKVQFNSITVSGTSLTFYTNTLTDFLALPVNPEVTETTFLFSYQQMVDGVAETKSTTLTLGYVNEIKLISEECGAFQYQRDLAIGSTDFEKTKIMNTSLLTGVTSNLEIYF